MDIIFSILESKGWVERFHPRDPLGKFSVRGFDITNVEPIPAFAQHVGKPWYGVDDWGDVSVSQEKLKERSDAYANLPDFDPNVAPQFDHMMSQLRSQYKILTVDMGVKVEVLDHDPYPDVQSMLADLEQGRLKVLGTAATPPGHPYYTNEENDLFRAVHDAFGHGGTGRGFDRHGEEAAYEAHANMFDDVGRQVLATELRAQNAALIVTGGFVPQKLGLLDMMHAKSATYDPDVDNAYGRTGSHHTSNGRWKGEVSEGEQATWDERRRSVRGEQKDFNPHQPRIPAGKLGAGRWGSGGIVGAILDGAESPRQRSAVTESSELEPEFFARFHDKVVSDEFDGFGDILQKRQAATKANLAKELRERIKSQPGWQESLHGALGHYELSTPGVGSDEVTWAEAVGVDLEASHRMTSEKRSVELKKEMGELREIWKRNEETLRAAISNPEFFADSDRSTMNQQFNVAMGALNTFEDETSLSDSLAHRQLRYDALDVSEAQKLLRAAFQTSGRNDLLALAVPREDIINPISMKHEVRVPFFPFPTGEDASAEIKLAVMTRRYIDQWAVSSGDSDARSIAVQLAVHDWTRREFGESAGETDNLKKYADVEEDWYDRDEDEGLPVTPWEESFDILKTDGAFLDSFITAQYEATQAYFKEKDIQTVRLHRGMYFASEQPWMAVPENEKATVVLNPASSWTASSNVASSFARGAPYSKSWRVEMTAAVPVSDILATTVTGFGSLPEEEVVVLGWERRLEDVSTTKDEG